MTMTNEVREASQALADELDAITPKQAADAAARYAVLKDAEYITSDGDRVTQARYKAECDHLNEIIKRFIEREGGPLFLEGIGEFKLQERSAGKQYDVGAFFYADPEAFRRLVDMGCLKVDEKVLKAQVDAGNIAVVPPFTVLKGTAALVIDRKAGR